MILFIVEIFAHVKFLLFHIKPSSEKCLYVILYFPNDIQLLNGRKKLENLVFPI